MREVSHAYGLPLDPEREVHTLSVGERQRIEIVRCLLQSPRLLIMDEPTSVLTPQEVDKLFETLRQLAAEGCSILYISHKLHEIKALVRPRHHPARRQGGGPLRPQGRDREEHGAADDRRRAPHAGAAPGRRGRRAAAGRPRPRPAQRGAARHRPEAHHLRGPGRRDLRHRRRGRQRPERAAAGAVGRADASTPDMPIRIDGKAGGPARSCRAAASSACAPCPRSATATPPCPR